MQDDEVIIIIECKQAKCNLNDANMSQLYRYFTVTNSRIAILTNGVTYLFFTDLEEANKMDSRPFLELDMLNLRKSLLKEVKKLGKDKFDLDRMLSTANELKYTSQIKKVMRQQFENPDENFVKFFFNATNSGCRFTASAKEQFTEFVKKASYQFINESVSDFLDSVKAVQKEVKETEEDNETVDDKPNGIVTTEEELEGYQIVRAIACQKVDPNRIVHRDTKSYFGILLDDNNRKAICRLHFNSAKKNYIGLFDENKKETRHPLDELSDIYKFSQEILETISLYEETE